MPAHSPRTGREIIAFYTRRDRWNQQKHGQAPSEWGLSTRPEYYSGRGAITCDLCSTKLEMIYDGVKAEYGDEAAARFVQFVYDFDKLAATLFLNAFFSFGDRGCQWTPREHARAEEVDVGPDHGDGTREAIGQIGIANVFGGLSDRDETPMIRGRFLENHKDEFTPDPNRPQETAFGYIRGGRRGGKQFTQYGSAFEIPMTEDGPYDA